MNTAVKRSLYRCCQYTPVVFPRHSYWPLFRPEPRLLTKSKTVFKREQAVLKMKTGLKSGAVHNAGGPNTSMSSSCTERWVLIIAYGGIGSWLVNPNLPAPVPLPFSGCLAASGLLAFALLGWARSRREVTEPLA